MPLSTVATGQQTAASQLNQIINLLTGVMNDQVVTISNNLIANSIRAAGLNGATTGARFVGGTTTGAPTGGTFSTGDYVVTQDGRVWVCTAAGTPGTWQQPAPPPNTNAALIQPVGTTAAAGSTGLSADAGHIHTGAGLLNSANVWTADQTVQGNIIASGASAAVWFYDRSGPEHWAWYGFGSIARLYSGSGDVVSFDDVNKRFGINTGAPGYLLDVFNSSGVRVYALDQSGNVTYVGGGYLSTSNYVQAGRFVSYSGNVYLDAVASNGFVYFRTNNGGTTVAYIDNAANLNIASGGAVWIPSSADTGGSNWTGTVYRAVIGWGNQARQIFTGNTRNDSFAVEGDILVNG